MRFSRFPFFLPSSVPPSFPPSFLSFSFFSLPFSLSSIYHSTSIYECLVCALHSHKGWEHSSEPARRGLHMHQSFEEKNNKHANELQRVPLNSPFCTMRISARLPLSSPLVPDFPISQLCHSYFNCILPEHYVLKTLTIWGVVYS